jgi:hypothetical protein
MMLIMLYHICQVTGLSAINVYYIIIIIITDSLQKATTVIFPDSKLSRTWYTVE